MTAIILHEDPASGNCYKIRLTAAHVGVMLDRRSYDIRSGETRTAAFLAEVDAGGRIPVLQIGDRFLPESNAACAWLAHDSALIPADRFDRADMLRWMFWEQYSHEPNVATLRFWRHFIGEAALTPAQRALVPSKEAAGRDALALLERHLTGRDWLVGDAMTLADIVLYAYTHVAEEGGFVLSASPALTAWLARVAAQPGHIRFDP
ncbi:glutathione S-transferase family protein [Sphingomonas radiodurans]|uniref:glutathione S-transferase family protein n=1 Tax=Sphingomonas radiodurans TaxID=2890321 RepID=UPI001E52831A|nr:glutathione S-transferase family protein [Sphingomonas radiodurans]WBH15190.1 glutathione S-transferase family protein [Sphingomonas radiodurans]